MVRKRDVMKNELRAYFGLKSVRGWEQFGGWKLLGLNTEHIWDKLQEEYEKKKGSFRETHSTSVSKTGVTSEKRHDPIVRGRRGVR